jgi:hypothetical protein
MQVEDSLRLHRGGLAAAVLHASSERDLISIATDLRIEHPWWSRWLSTYARVPGEVASDGDISVLRDDDGVLAWTAANVLLHAAINESGRERLAEIAKSASDEGARWRAVHVLGSADDPWSLAVLVERLRTDSSQWVRNGALRSAILVASRLHRPEERAQFFLGLTEMSGELLNNPKWLREIERSTQLDTQPKDWPAAVGILLEVLWAASNSVEEQDRWRRLSASLRTHWAGSSKLGSL